MIYLSLVASSLTVAGLYVISILCNDIVPERHVRT